MTRDEEIEALAMQIHAQWTIEYHQRTGDWPEGENRDAMFEDHISTAMGVVAARDRYRAARQPAPETPTPRIEVLDVEKLAVEIADAVGLPCDAAKSIIARKIRAHAATLKERKEKADG